MRRILVFILFFSMVAAACGGTTTLSESGDENADAAGANDASTEVDTEPRPTQAPEPTAVPAPTEEAEPEPTAAPEPTATPEPEQTFWSDVLVVGDCINRPDTDESALPEIISCDELHEEEIYAIAQLDMGPDEPYPGSDALADMVDTQLCADATTDFAGATWDLLPFPTFLLYPLEDEWEGGDRGIMCSAGAPDDVDAKIGTAAGGSLDSNDILLARASFTHPDVGDFLDWVLIDELRSLDDAASLSDGQFDLQLRRPFAVTQGFIFNAPLADDENGPVNTWGYNWTDGEFTDLGSILPGEQLSSTASVNGQTIFAARPTADDDWDLWVANSDQGAVPLDDSEGSQHYPTFTPDGDRVVYHSDGNIWITNVDGSDRKQLTDTDASDYESAVSPDGQWIAFASNRSGNDDIWLMGIDGDSPVNLSNHPADESWPVWNADGSILYFQSDRLRPIDDRNVVMMMNPDGSNPSWFSAFGATHPMVADPAFASDALAAAPTLDERYGAVEAEPDIEYEVVAGDPDNEFNAFTYWGHSSERLEASLPPSWMVGEFPDGTASFLAAEDPDAYFSTWSTDGVFVTLHDVSTEADFLELYEGSLVLSSCERVDGSDGLVEFEPGKFAIGEESSCGDEGASGQVVGFYEPDNGLAVIIEGQRDNLPDEESDSDLLDRIASSVDWFAG